MSGQTKAQHPVHFNDGLGGGGLRISRRIGRGGNVSAADDLAPDRFDLLAVLENYEVNRFAFVQRQEQFLRNGIVAVILLENLQRASARIAQNDRIRLDMGRNSANSTWFTLGLRSNGKCSRATKKFWL